MQQNEKLGPQVPAALDLDGEFGLGRALAAALACGAELLALALLAVPSSAAQSAPRRESVELSNDTTPGWLRRALRHRAGGLPPAAPTDDPHASALTVELVVAEAQSSAARVDLSDLVVEVLIVARDSSAPSWTTVARIGADGRATFARVPEGRPHVLVLAPDAESVPLVPDPARYGLLYESFSGGQFPHLALDEDPTEGSTRVVRLHLVQGRRAAGVVELRFPLWPALGVPPEQVPVERALAWVASPGWLQVAPLEAGGVYTWIDPRPVLAVPFDPAAPTAGFLERLTGGVTAPLGAGECAWRACTGVPAPPVGQPFVIELATGLSVERAVGPVDRHSLSTSESEPGAARATADAAAPAAALARWRALCATPLAPPLAASTESRPRTASVLTRAERVALARTLLDPVRDREGIVRLIAEACRLAQDPPGGEGPGGLDLYADQHDLLELVRQWLALGAEGSEEAELALLDRAQDIVETVVEQLHCVLFSAEVPLQLWIDVVAPRYPGYAEALAAFSPKLRAPRRAAARGALPDGLTGLDREALIAVLRQRPSSTLGAELAQLVRVAPRDGAERLLAGFAALARDDVRGRAVRDGAIDLLLALGERPAGDSGGLAELELAEIVLDALGDEPSDVTRTEAVLAALAPLAPARALADARAALDAFDAAASNGAVGTLPPLGALLALAALEPLELAQRARVTQRYATFAAAALLLEGQGALDARGLPQAFLERLLR